MLYDNAFESRFPNTDEAINGILVHTKTFFLQDSLGTIIELDVDPNYQSVGTTLTANDQNLL